MKVKVYSMGPNALNLAISQVQAGCTGKDGFLLGFQSKPYATDPALALELITEKRISITIKHDGVWIATIYDLNDEPTFMHSGQTPLIAAARCFLASVVGDVATFEGAEKPSEVEL